MEQNVSNLLLPFILDPINTIKKLMNEGLSVNCSNSEGYTPLHLAVTCGDEDHMKKVILTLVKNKDNSLNAQDKNGQTALHYVAGRGLVNVAKLLIKHGADINIADNKNIRPIDCAIYECDEEAVSFFLRVGAFYPECAFRSIHKDADPDIINMLIPFLHDLDSVRNKFGETLLHVSVQFLNECITEILMDNGASVNATCTLLHETTLHKVFKSHQFGHRYFIVLSAMLDRLPDISAKSTHGHTPFDVFVILEDERGGYTEPQLKDIFIKYICRLYAAQMFNLLDQNNLNKMIDLMFPDMIPYYNECKEEVEYMKNTVIEDVSLYSILTRSPESLVRLLKNENIYCSLEQNIDNYLSLIPCYKKIIEVKLKTAKERSELIKSCQSFYTCFNLPNLPPHFVDDILKHLTKLELISLREACRER